MPRVVARFLQDIAPFIGLVSGNLTLTDEAVSFIRFDPTAEKRWDTAQEVERVFIDRT